MNEIADYLPLIIPVILIQLTLIAVGLLDLRKRRATRGPKWLWAVVIIFVNLVGPIAYFVIGREDD